MKPGIFALLISLVTIRLVAADRVFVDSPSGKMSAEILIDKGKVTYSVLFNGKAVISGAAIGITVTCSQVMQCVLQKSGRPAFLCFIRF